MYTQVPLSENVRSALESLGVPIRVLRGNAHTFQPPVSWRGAATANRTTLADCEERGLTVVSWAAPSATDSTTYIVPALAGFMYSDGNAPVGSIGIEWVNPNTSGIAFNSGSYEVFGNTELSERQYAVAGYKTVWLLFPIHNIPFQDQANLDLEKLLLQPARVALANGERQALIAAQQEAQASEAAKQAFLNVMNNRRSNRRTAEQAEQDASEQRRAIIRREEQIASLVSRMREYIREAKMLKDNPPEEPDWSDTWQRLLEHPKVIRVSADSRWINVYTTELPIHHEDSGSSFYLGKFKIQIPVHGEDGYLPRLNNLDNQHEESYYDHPHVEEGTPCYGGSATLVAELIDKGELPGLLEYLFQYLESYNPNDSMGANITYWRDRPWPRNGQLTLEKKEEEVKFETLEPSTIETDSTRYTGDPATCQCSDCRQARGE